MFKTMEEMRDEIRELKAILAEKIPQDDTLFNANEAAAYCGVARQTIYAWTREHRIRRVVRRGRRGYLKSELDTIKQG